MRDGRCQTPVPKPPPAPAYAQTHAVATASTPGVPAAAAARLAAARRWLLPDARAAARFDRSLTDIGELQDHLVCDLGGAAAAAALPGPEPAFDCLRWGGQVVLLGDTAEAVGRARAAFLHRPEWACEQDAPAVLPGAAGRPAPGYAATVRKVLLEPPGRLTARHSYAVALHPAAGPADAAALRQGHGWTVEKRVPTVAEALSRLKQTHPGLDPDRAAVLAEKLVMKAFPLLLTREAAFLRRLQTYLPDNLKPRTPELHKLEVDERGFARRLELTWLRMGGPPLSQLQFARGAAEMVAAAHTHATLMHLDLRLGNFVITERGVGLIDFGSSVMLNEDLTANRAVNSVIREMLLASEISHDLRRHRNKRLADNPAFTDLPYPPAAGYDLFALATCMTRPHDFDEFRGIVTFDRDGDDALRLSRLRQRVLLGTPNVPPIASVQELAEALDHEG